MFYPKAVSLLLGLVCVTSILSIVYADVYCRCEMNCGQRFAEMAAINGGCAKASNAWKSKCYGQKLFNSGNGYECRGPSLTDTANINILRDYCSGKKALLRCSTDSQCSAKTTCA